MLVQTTIKEDQSEEEEAQTLIGSFRASYGLSSLNLAIEKAREFHNKGKSIYFFYTLVGFPEDFTASYGSWSNSDLKVYEQIANTNERMRQFISDFGTHYVREVKYGARISIRAGITSTDSSIQTALSGQIKAAFGAFSVGGKVSDEAKSLSHNSNLSITAEIVAGGVKPNTQAIVLTSIEQVLSFLDDFSRNKVTLVPGPIEITLKSYWATLLKSPHLHDDFAMKTTTPPPAPYGVPAGTVVAWYPRKQDVVTQTDGTLRFNVPDGWSLCDGKDHPGFRTPNLTDEFILGTNDPNLVATTTGSDAVALKGYGHPDGNHVINELTTQREAVGGTPKSIYQTEVFVSGKLPKPPSVYLVYIMRNYQ